MSLGVGWPQARKLDKTLEVPGKDMRERLKLKNTTSKVLISIDRMPAYEKKTNNVTTVLPLALRQRLK